MQRNRLALCLAALFVALAATSIQAQVTITSPRLAPDPPTPLATNWLLVDFQGGEIKQIILRQSALKADGSWAFDQPREIPPPESLSGKKSGTLKLTHHWMNISGFSEKRTIDLELTDMEGKKATAKIPFALSEWKASSPLKLKSITFPQSPAVGKKSYLQIAFDPAPVKPKTLYVEIEMEKGINLLEQAIPEADQSPGQIKWEWLPSGPGERKFRIWVVDEKGGQTNYLEAKITP